MTYTKVNPRQSFPQLEEEILKFWKEENIFQESIDTRPEDNPYRFYDGPPFITGTPHYGSLLSSICKDVIPRYFTMKGKRVERAWGWDCHGLPIEEKVQKKLGLESSRDIEEKVGIKKFIEECYTYTEETSAEWGWYIDHIGRWVDMDNAYKTMDQDYMESVMWVFKQMWDKNMVYKGQRVSLYSWKLSTPISNFEVAMDDSYEEVSDPAITVMFPLSNSSENTKEGDFLLAWTTTPWTIPAHMSIAVNSKLIYSRVLSEGKYYILAKNRIEIVFKGKEFEIINDIEGKELVDLKYKAPFNYYQDTVDADKNFKVLDADFVTDTDGTGIAHQAPEFGDVDFQLAKEKGVHISGALDNEGKYTEEISDYEGIHYIDANPIIADKLKELGLLFKKESINHRVAMCPRSGTPLIYKAQDSWFVNIQDLKEKLISENEGINWSPSHLKHGQFLKSMEGAPDWCISRTRYWGTPMPIWVGRDTEGNEKDMKVFGNVADLEKISGMKVKSLHRPYIDDIKWEKDGLKYTRIPEVLDVWMDSGSMPYAQMHYPFENKQAMESSYPADFIVEYIGQVRAWFYVMHVVGVALFDMRSFTNVITTGIVNGTDGRKMSKSYGNYPDPKNTIQKYGADAIRFYMMNSPLMHGGNMSFKEEGVHEVIKKVILPLWNTYSFFTTYANIDKFEVEEGNVYFVRHGQSINNTIPGKMNPGDVDSPLTDLGTKQAYTAGKEAKLEGTKFDVIITSPLSRAYDTAKIIADETGYIGKIIQDERLKEQFAGKLKDYTHDQLTKEFGVESVADRRRFFKDKKNNGVESLEEFTARVNEVISEINEKYKGKNVLVVTHSGTSRPFNAHYYNLDTEYASYEAEGFPNSVIIKFPKLPLNNPLDKWIMSELHKLIGEIGDGLDNYRINDSTRNIPKFMDNLTNWYIRRSRKRFWKSENDSDKLEAYNTLHEVLVTISKIIAPFMPFVSESIYKNLTGKRSVHLDVFPNSVKAFINKELSDDMAKTQKIINLGLAWRVNHKLRVRQPLSSLTIGEKLGDYYKSILKEELNIKEVIEINGEELAKKICKPNGRLIGPKFGKDVKLIISEAKAGNFEELDENRVFIPCIDTDSSHLGNNGFILEEGEFELVFEVNNDSGSSYEIEAGFGMVIAIDPELTPDLINEGIARDLVRFIQEGRKESDYQVDDRILININFDTDNQDKLDLVLKDFKEYIEAETLSKLGNSLSLDNWDLEKEVEIGDIKVVIKLKK